MKKAILVILGAVAAVAILMNCSKDEKTPAATAPVVTSQYWACSIPGDTVTMPSVRIDHNFIYKISDNAKYLAYDSLFIYLSPAPTPMTKKVSTGSWHKNDSQYVFIPDSCLAPDQSYNHANCPDSSVAAISGDTLIFNGYPVFGQLKIVKRP